MNDILELDLLVDKDRKTPINDEMIPIHGAKMISGFEMRIIHMRIRLLLLGIAVVGYRNPVDWLGALKYLTKLRRRFLGDYRLQKMAYAGGRYYMGLYTAGWDSGGYATFMRSQLNDYKPIRGRVNRFNTVFMAVTKKCALQCEHCFEWEHLNKKDVLSPEKLSLMVRKLQVEGVSQIQFSGGEPLLKIDWLIQVLQSADKTTDFWVATSGFKLTPENARSLKLAGLTGVIISLDHYIPEKHNAFRGFKDAFYWVEEAVKQAKLQDLVVALSLCTTREFLSKENLMAYMELAKKWGVSFVQFLEPKAVGHYKGLDVVLRQADFELLEDFYQQMNFNAIYANYPIVTYHGQHLRRQGCYGSGVKGLYVDTDGDINPCPFCPTKMGSLLDTDFDNNLRAMTAAGCPSYNT